MNGDGFFNIGGYTVFGYMQAHHFFNGSCTINGDLNVETKGNTFVNYHRTADERLAVKGDANVKSSGQWSFVRNTDVDGNLTMSNDGGFVDVGNANIKGDANLTTTGVEQLSSTNYNHYVSY